MRGRSEIRTPLGPMIAEIVDGAICRLEFTDQAASEDSVEEIAGAVEAQPTQPDDDLLDSLVRQLNEYFSGTRMSFELPFDYRGSEFQRRVWEELSRIPYGETRSYADVALSIGTPGAARAVGQANGRNQIAIIIPCHRVIAADGGIGGYGGGLWRKLRLLEREGVSIQQPYDAQ